MAQSVKNLPAMQETQVQSLGWEDPLEKEMATHSSIFAWGIPWTEKPGGLQSLGLQELDMTLSNQTTTISAKAATTTRDNPALVIHAQMPASVS